MYIDKLIQIERFLCLFIDPTAHHQVTSLSR